VTSQAASHFKPLPLGEHVELVEHYELDTLLFCPDAWALRHRFVNTQTGETVRARCGSWSCLYCGPRKVDMWRQLVKAAEPTLFITLTQVGKTLKEAARVLTTVLQYIRRGSNGRGKNRRGARPAYPIQVFAVLEEHSDFEHVGFHWHLLVKGVDFLPNQVVSDALSSATKGRSYITKVVRVRNNTAVGYVTKYLTKEIMREYRGIEEQQRVVPMVALDEAGGSGDGRGGVYEYKVRQDHEQQAIEVKEVQVVERLCKAHRIRYSRSFFPERTADLRRLLFGEQEETPETQILGGKEALDTTLPAKRVHHQVPQEQDSAIQESCQLNGTLSLKHEGSGDDEQDGKRAGKQAPEIHAMERTLDRATSGLSPDQVPQGQDSTNCDEMQKDRTVATRDEVRSVRWSVWVLHESDPFSDDIREYKRRRRRALAESLAALREGRRLYSRRVVGIWAYQRDRLRQVA
jgi:hypothetical protein